MRRRALLASLGGVGVVGPAMSGCAGSGGDDEEADRTKWVAESGGSMLAVTDEKIVYLARDDEGGTAYPAALDLETGERLWTSWEATCGGLGGCRLAPTVADAVYLGTYSDYAGGGGAMYAIDADSGEIVWERTTSTVSGLRVFDDVLFVSHSNSLHVLDTETGETIWSHSLDESQSIPPISSNTVYLPIRRHLLGLHPTDGRERWRYTSDVGRISLAAVIDDIAFCHADNVVMAIDGGEQRWSTEFDEEIELFAFDSETLIVGNEDWSRLWGVDATNGDRLWSNGFLDGASILRTGDEYLIVGVEQSRIHRVDAKTGRKQWVIEGTYPRRVKAIDERLYVVDDPGETLSAINIRTGRGVWNRPVSEEEFIQDIYVVQEPHSTLDHSVYLHANGPDPNTLYQYGASGDLVWSREIAGDIARLTFEECLYVGTKEHIYAFELA